MLLINVIVDPYDIVGWIDRPGFNAWKPAVATRMRLLKAFEIRRRKPVAIAIGTSRTHVALSPTHPAWPAHPVYNLAFDGATPAEMYAYLRHAQAVRPLSVVIMGVDTWQLEGAPSSVRPDFDASVLLADDTPWSRAGAELARLRILLSLDTLAKSWTTLTEQSGASQPWLAPDGQRRGDVFFRKIEPTFVHEGPAAYFEGVDRQEIGFKLPETPAPGASPPTGPGFSRKATPHDSMEDLIAIIAFCRQHNVDLRLYLTPAHAHQSEIAALMGETPAIERGKRRLVAALEQDGARAGRPPFPLWDFSGYNSVTIDPLPQDPRREMAFYWDSSHFKSQVGDWVLDRVLSSGGVAPPDFGRRLTPQTIEPELAAIQAGHEAYARTHPAEVAHLTAVLAEARRAKEAGR